MQLECNACDTYQQEDTMKVSKKFTECWWMDPSRFEYGILEDSGKDSNSIGK